MERSVSVIIPTYYRYGPLRDVLDALSSQSCRPLEVIVADQTPAGDRPPQFYGPFSEKMPLAVIDFEQPSITRPRNVAASKAAGDVLIFLDDDVLIGDDFVEAHLRVMERERVDVVNGATTLKENLPEEYPWSVETMDPVRFFLAAPNHKWEGMMLGVSSCNFSIRREIFHAVGGFDEQIPRMVDFELGYRLFRHGAKIHFSSEPFARHLRAPGGSRKDPAAHNKLVAQLYLHKKHFPGWITRQFVLKYLYSHWVRRRNVIQPWLPIQRTLDLVSASAEAERRLRKVER